VDKNTAKENETTRKSRRKEMGKKLHKSYVATEVQLKKGRKSRNNKSSTLIEHKIPKPKALPPKVLNLEASNVEGY